MSVLIMPEGLPAEVEASADGSNSNDEKVAAADKARMEVMDKEESWRKLAFQGMSPEEREKSLDCMIHLGLETALRV